MFNISAHLIKSRYVSAEPKTQAIVNTYTTGKKEKQLYVLNNTPQ